MWKSLLATIGLFAVVTAVVFSGCGDPNGPQAVSGSITFQGKPLDQGTISFFAPDAPSPAAACLITDGRYDIPASQGLIPGKYLVRITSTEEFRITPDEYAAGKTAPPAKERIAAKFNTESQTTVEVKPSGGNRFDYQVE